MKQTRDPWLKHARKKPLTVRVGKVPDYSRQIAYGREFRREVSERAEILNATFGMFLSAFVTFMF